MNSAARAAYAWRPSCGGSARTASSTCGRRCCRCFGSPGAWRARSGPRPRGGSCRARRAAGGRRMCPYGPWQGLVPRPRTAARVRRACFVLAPVGPEKAAGSPRRGDSGHAAAEGRWSAPGRAWGAGSPAPPCSPFARPALPRTASRPVCGPPARSLSPRSSRIEGGADRCHRRRVARLARGDEPALRRGRARRPRAARPPRSPKHGDPDPAPRDRGA